MNSVIHSLIHLLTTLSLTLLLLPQDPKIPIEVVQLQNAWRFEKAS